MPALVLNSTPRLGHAEWADPEVGRAMRVRPPFRSLEMALALPPVPTSPRHVYLSGHPPPPATFASAGHVAVSEFSSAFLGSIPLTPFDRWGILLTTEAGFISQFKERRGT